MKHPCTILATILPALCALAVPRYWEADVHSPAAFQTAAYRGETVQLTARLADRGAPFEVPAGATARMLVSTNDFRDGCWEWPAAVSTSGLVRATWTPDMDPGGPAVRIFLAVSESGTNVNYGANCTMRLLGSPGATPNALPLPAATIDFAAVRALNAPWLESFEETDPTVPAWAKSPTPPLTEESDPTVPEWAKAAEPPLPAESDPVFAEWAETNGYSRTVNGIVPKNGNLEISATNGIVMNGVIEQNVFDPGWKRLISITFGLDPDYMFDFPTFSDLEYLYGETTNYTDSAVATRLTRSEAEDGFTEWRANDLPAGWRLASFEWESGPDRWEYWIANGEGTLFGSNAQGASATDTNISCSVYVGTAWDNDEIHFTASRTRLRPTAAMEAAWDAKLDESDLSGYATSADLAAVEASASLVGLLLQGSNVVAEVTNYNSRVHAPELRLLQLSESNEYFTVWTETNGLARTLASAIEHADGATNALDAAKADRAWSHHTSGLGADAPDGYTWMSTPYTVIAGGLEYEKHVTTGGAIWILKANGMMADFHAQTNNTAYLDLSSADGSPIFRVEKTDSYLVGVDVTSLSVDGSTLICGVNAIAPSHPYARVRPSLNTGDWINEEDYTESGGVTTIPGIATIEWSGSSGAYVCEITSLTGGNSFFACMEYLQEGGTKIVNAAALDVSAGILCTDGIHKVRPVYNNGSVTWEVMQ